jgi:signal peptidase I
MTVASRFNRDGLHAWTWDNFGPLTVPKEGMTIEINAETLNHYGQVIQHYEHLNGVSMADGKLSIDGKEVTSYTFTQDYYFMMGDNRHDSSDSRIWGFVPADHIVGKALFTWWSIDDQTPWSEFFEKVRWERIFTLID